MHAAHRNHSDERGVTLIEVAIVGVLAAIVMLAMTGFYINSQSTWIEASSQAVTQREATTVLEAIGGRAHEAYGADLSTPQRLVFFDLDGECSRFWVGPDSLMHQGDRLVADRGPMAASVVTRFVLSGSNDSTMVKVLSLEMRSANGHLVRLSTNAAFYNRPAP